MELGSIRESDSMSNSNEQLSGTVAEFDFHRGLGVVVSANIRYLFHCAEITDESRNIAVGTAVLFLPIVRFGLLEASQVKKI